MLPAELVSRSIISRGPADRCRASQRPDAMQKDAAMSDGKCYVAGTAGRAINPGQPQSATYA